MAKSGWRIPSAFESPDDEYNGMGRKPVVIDILGTDWQTSILPDDAKFVFHVNPSNMDINYTKTVSRIQTMGGYVEQVWGTDTTEISMSMQTGAFMRMNSGLSAMTNPDWGGTRRDSIAYDKYQDLLALFHNNGAVYGENGQIIRHGIISLYFDQVTYLGWFTTFAVTESAENPYKFDLTASFSVHKEIHIGLLPQEEIRF